MDDLSDLWQRWTQGEDRDARDALILHYAPLVKQVVGRVKWGMPPSLEEEDLVSYGTIGLIKAVDAFKPERGVKFETYAVLRIRGNIIDSLRSIGQLPRSTFRRARAIEDASAQLCQELGRIPEDSEIVERLGISLETYHNHLADINRSVISLDRQLVSSSGDNFSLYDSVEDESMPSPVEHLDQQELKTRMISAIKALPEREQLMIALYYQDRLTMKEIGDVLGISESRVSQLHAKIILTLRGFMKSSGETPLATNERRDARVAYYAAVR
jgi:RNA polymerase sigma factor FliA